MGLGFTHIYMAKKRNTVFQKKIFVQETHIMMKNIQHSLLDRIKLNDKAFYKNRSLFLVTEHILLRNSYNNLISNQTANIIYKKHIFDSLSISAILKSFWFNKKIKNCIDFGTGGGFPGLLIAILFPEIFISLLDSVERKTKFHMGILDILDLKNCNSICIRGEKIFKSIVHREKYDIVTSRAVSELIDLLQIFSIMSNIEGKFIAMKKIKSSGKEIKKTFVYFSEPKFKLKCLIKVDRTNTGKMVLIYKKI